VCGSYINCALCLLFTSWWFDCALFLYTITKIGKDEIRIDLDWDFNPLVELISISIEQLFKVYVKTLLFKKQKGCFRNQGATFNPNKEKKETVKELVYHVSIYKEKKTPL
jgi:hypothetical protein